MNGESVKSFFIYGISIGISKFAGVVLLPVYTRYYSETEYGIIDIIQTVVNIVTIFGILQLETSLQRYYYEVDEKNRKKIASTILIFTTSISLGLMLVLQFFASRISEICFQSVQYSRDLIIAAFMIPLINISTISYVIIRYMKKTTLFSVITLLQIAVSAVSTIFFILYCNLGITSVFYGQLLGYIILICIQFMYLRDLYIWSFNYKNLKQLLAFALPQFPARIGSTVNAYFNRFLILGVLSVSSIGLYSVALKCASIISIVQTAFVLVWNPFLYETIGNPNQRVILKKYFKYVLCGVGIFIAVISLFSKEFIILITSPDFYDAHYYVGGLSLYIGLFIIKEYVDIGPRVTKKTAFISYTYIISAIINCLLLYFFTRHCGLYGVVWAMIFTNILLVVMSWGISEKLYYIGFSKIAFLFSLVFEIGIVITSMYFEIPLIYRILILGLILFHIVILHKNIISEIFQNANNKK
jgi:O-antigen/teichoic acid export membrane protein